MQSKAVQSVLSFIASTQLAIALLVLIALSSVLGTILPQDRLAQGLSRDYPMLHAIMGRMGLFDVFHSVWFMILEAALTLNLIACTWQRIPLWWRRFRARHEAVVKPDAPSPKRSIFRSGDIAKIEARTEEKLVRLYGKGQREEVGSSLILSWKKNAASALGVPIIHLGVLIIIAGAAIGSFFGFEGMVRIAEGDSIQSIFLKGNGEEKALDFTVRCNLFSVSFYENGAPREFKSDLEFSRDGKVLQKAVLRVNEPVTFGGIRFYQESYGTIPDEIVLGMTEDSGPEKELRLRKGESLSLSGGTTRIRIIRAEENLMGFGPGVKLGISSAGQETQFWVFQDIEKLKRENPGLLKQVPLFDPGRFKPYRFFLKKIANKNYTGLLVSRDPGVPLIFAGFIVVIIGCCVLYLLPYRRIIVRMDPEKKGVRIGVECIFERHKTGQKLEAEKLMSLLAEEK